MTRDRKEGWETALIEIIEAWQSKPFTWGSDDCLGFGLACFEAVRGAPLVDALPDYDGPETADAAIAAMGFSGLDDALAAHLEECPVSLAWRGDLGTITHNGRPAVVVNAGDGAWVGKAAAGGLIRIAPSQVNRAFKV